MPPAATRPTPELLGLILAPANDPRLLARPDMATTIKMPKMSDTMTEGTIASWLKKVGDVVKSGDILAEVETDKATMELENYEDGTLLFIGPQAGEAVAVDGVLAIIGKAGEDISALLGGQSGGAAAPAEAPKPAAAAPAPAPAAGTPSASSAPVITPALDTPPPAPEASAPTPLPIEPELPTAPDAPADPRP